MFNTTAQHDEADIIVLPHQQPGPPQPGVWTPWTVHEGEFYPSFYALCTNVYCTCKHHVGDTKLFMVAEHAPGGDVVGQRYRALANQPTMCNRVGGIFRPDVVRSVPGAPCFVRVGDGRVMNPDGTTVAPDQEERDAQEIKNVVRISTQNEERESNKDVTATPHVMGHEPRQHDVNVENVALHEALARRDSRVAELERETRVLGRKLRNAVDEMSDQVGDLQEEIEQLKHDAAERARQM